MVSSNIDSFFSPERVTLYGQVYNLTEKIYIEFGIYNTKVVNYNTFFLIIIFRIDCREILFFFLKKQTYILF